MNEELLNEFSNILKEKNININDILSNIKTENIDKNEKNNLNNNSHSNNTSNNNTTHTPENNSNSTNNSSSINYSDIENIIKMKSFFDKATYNNSQNVELLQALKPFMKDSRKEKIDKYAKMLKFAEVAKMLDLFGGDKK